MQVACPQCRKRLNAPESALGETARCPACGASVALVATQVTEPVASALDPPGRDDSGTFVVTAAEEGSTEASVEIALPRSPAPRTLPNLIDDGCDTSTETLGMPSSRSGEVKLPEFTVPESRRQRAEQVPRRPHNAVPSRHQTSTFEGVSTAPASPRTGLLPFARRAKTIRVAARTLDFPPYCPCCMRAADTTYEARHVRTVRRRRVVRSETRWWTFPYCSNCLEHEKRARQSSMLAAAMTAVPIIVLFTLGVALNGVLAFLIVAAVVGAIVYYALYNALLERVRRAVRSSCASLGAAVTYDDVQGTEHTFSFANADYAAMFAAENRKKLR